MKFCEYIKKLRESSGLTQENVAELIGVSVTTIQNWEKGQLPSGKENLGKIMKVYNADRHEFLSYYGEEIAPRETTENFYEFPTFLFPKDDYEDILKLTLSADEQELLGLEMIYLHSYDFNGDAKDERFNYDCKFNGKQTNLLAELPYDYIKSIGAYRVMKIHKTLHKKIGKYKNNILSFLMEYPDFVFDIKKMTPNDIYITFNPDIKDILKALIEITSVDKKALYYNGSHIFGNYEINAFDIIPSYEEEMNYKNMHYGHRVSKKYEKYFQLEDGPMIDTRYTKEEYLDLFPEEHKCCAGDVDSMIEEDGFVHYRGFDTFIKPSDAGKQMLDWYKKEGHKILSLS